MDKQLKRLGLSLTLAFAVYTILSYLIFLRDDFLLERISVLMQTPSLLELGRQWANMLHVNSLPTPLYFITVMLMFIVYFRALHYLRREKSRKAAAKMIVKFAVVFMGATLLSFPALSTDVFDYIATNRVLFVHQANPWLEAPQNFPQDEFIYLGSWKFRASVYGPVQFLFSSFVHGVAGNSIIANIIGFKLTGLIFTGAAIWLMKKWLEQFASENLTYGLAVFAWNPLIHIEIIGNAHNDIIMAFFALLGFYWVSTTKSIQAAIGFAMAVLAKVATLLYIPIIAIWLLTRKRKRRATTFLVVFVLITVVGFATLGKGMMGFIKNLGVQFGLYLRSLPTIVRFFFLQTGITQAQASIAEKLITIPPVAAIFAVLLKRVGRTGVVHGMVAGMMIYLMLAAPMFQPWYLVWLLPFVALLKPQRLQAVALIFSWTSLLYYALLFTSFYFNPLHFAWQIAMFAFVVLPPLFIWIAPSRWYTRIDSIGLMGFSKH